MSDSVSPWNVACQTPSLSMGFPRPEYWSGLLFPSSGDLPDSGIESESPALAGRFFFTEPPGKLISSLSPLLKPLSPQSFHGGVYDSVCVCVCVSSSAVSDSLQPHGL